MKSFGRFLIRRRPDAETAESTNQKRTPESAYTASGKRDPAPRRSAVLFSKRSCSVLFQRAVIFAVAIMMAALMAGLPVYHLVDKTTAAKNAGAFLAAQTDALCKVIEKYGIDSTETHAAVKPVRELGLPVGFCDFSDGYQDIFDGEFLQADDEMNARMKAAYDGESVSYTWTYNDRKVITLLRRADSPDGMVHIVDTGAYINIFAGSRWASVLGLFAGFMAAFIVGWPLSKKLILRSDQQIADLRDTALKVTAGDFDARANEQAPGEIGEAGKALNQLSHQLSRSMYLLIVERNRLKHMLDGLSEGIIAIDADGTVSHVNPAVSRMFEQRRIALGFPDPRMKHLPDKSVWEDFDAVIRTGEAVTRNISSRDMIIRITITPIVDEIGATAGAVGLFSDITQMERLERTRREYVSNVSHELRTPLTAVRALVEPLKEGMVTREEDRMRYYEIILREVMRLSRLINDQLELSRLQSGSVAIEKRRMSMDDLIYDVCERYASIAEDSGLTLHIDSDLSGCPSVYANADRVEQMFIILLDNAIKYTEEGSVHVQVEWDDEKVLLTVRDTGIGIAEEDLPYVFDRFYKVDKAHSGKGSGLGLSIAKELLSRMGEDIWVTSEKGKGSAFTFTIHRNPSEEELAQQG